MWICCICCLYVVFPRPNRLAICPPDLWSARKTWLNARKSCEMSTSHSHSVSSAVILVSLADISQVLQALHRHFTSLMGTPHVWLGHLTKSGWANGKSGGSGKYNIQTQKYSKYTFNFKKVKNYVLHN